MSNYEDKAEVTREFYRRQGEVRERERIIKLLEADMEHAFGDDGECIYENHHREVCNCDVIALIKGENNGDS